MSSIGLTDTYYQIKKEITRIYCIAWGTIFNIM